MSQEGYDMEEIVGKFITGEATAEEKQLVLEWCAQSADNQKYVDHAQLIFDKAQLDDGQVYDVVAAWEKVKDKIESGRIRKLPVINLWRVAASLLLISVLSYFLYWQFFTAEHLQLTSEDEVITQALADNTEISLNKNSTIEVTYNERKKTGVIKLTGEATLTITSDKKVNWVVQTGEVFIRDIGTTFNVKAYPDTDLIEVSVLEGEVQFYTQTDEGILIQAGEKGLYDKSAKQFSKAEADPNVIAYKTLLFTFNDIDLKSAAEQLGSVYNRKIVVSANIENCRVTVDFENEDLDTILSVIAETLNLTVTNNENEIVLTGDGCL
ncbi:MAG TPA: FecR domain-containing protein [Cyclobacteriaceae bacterium]|nr:FecR domain-containing protein [Cyclobacteriaceae bacterium]HRJ83039.1 FecR domain-containing protein [Cyclobacteriaceae bacterium]